jgi:hypothetical protein
VEKFWEKQTQTAIFAILFLLHTKATNHVCQTKIIFIFIYPLLQINTQLANSRRSSLSRSHSLTLRALQFTTNWKSRSRASHRHPTRTRRSSGDHPQRSKSPQGRGHGGWRQVARDGALCVKTDFSAQKTVIALSPRSWNVWERQRLCELCGRDRPWHASRHQPQRWDRRFNTMG